MVHVLMQISKNPGLLICSVPGFRPIHYSIQTHKTHVTSMSVLLTVRPKCTLAVSHAAPWWVTVIMRRALY